MLSGAVLTAFLWLASGFPDANATEARPVPPPALENIYYVQVDGMT
jgi:hypothetical protein